LPHDPFTLGFVPRRREPIDLPMHGRHCSRPAGSQNALAQAAFQLPPLRGILGAKQRDRAALAAHTSSATDAMGQQLR
jgi:hypothetical protein